MFFEKIKLTKLQPDSSRKKEMRIKSAKLEMKKREVTTDNAEVLRIIRDYYEQLYENKMDNWKKWTDSRKVQSSKTEPGRNRNYEELSYKH